MIPQFQLLPIFFSLFLTVPSLLDEGHVSILDWSNLYYYLFVKYPGQINVGNYKMTVVVMTTIREM